MWDGAIIECVVRESLRNQLAFEESDGGKKSAR